MLSLLPGLSDFFPLPLPVVPIKTKTKITLLGSSSPFHVELQDASSQSTEHAGYMMSGSQACVDMCHHIAKTQKLYLRPKVNSELHLFSFCIALFFRLVICEGVITTSVTTKIFSTYYSILMLYCS